MSKRPLIISFSNKKGGVSKTTSAVNIASILGEKGKKVLLIDLDSQGNATTNLKVEPRELKQSTYDVLVDRDVRIDDTIIHTEYGIDLIGSNHQLQNAEIELHNAPARDSILKREIEMMDAEYDFIILDLAPDMGVVSLNGLIASTDVIVPVDANLFSITMINDVANYVEMIRDSGLNEDIRLMGVLITKLDSRTNLFREIPKMLRETLSYKVFSTEIRQNVDIVESQNINSPINFYSKTCNGYIEYEKVTNEILEIAKER